MRIIGIVGMPGSGKSDAAEAARSMGIPVVVMGDIVRKEVLDSGHEINPENLRSAMIHLRSEFGKKIVAERCMPALRALKSHGVVVVDGIRSLDEVEAFRRECSEFTILATHSSPKTRYRRLQERRRKDDPTNWDEFCRRDKIELSVGIGDAIALADNMVINEGTQAKFKENITKLLSRGVAID